MAIYAYFADAPGGVTLEWRDYVKKGQVHAAPGVRHDGGKQFSGYDPALGWVKITRRIEMKLRPSRHECDARCLNASGLIMKCECSCGGKNHGRGTMVCEAA